MEGIEEFKNRKEAGERLAKELEKYRGQKAIIYALPRGGVIVGAEVARRLDLPLDLILVRKIGHPLSPEFALGAITEDGRITGNIDAYDVDHAWLSEKAGKELTEIKRRRFLYFAGRPSALVTGKTAIIVDDGIATGSTMLASIEAIKVQKPQKIVVAVPVAPPDTAATIRSQVDEFVSLLIPDPFLGAVGAYYGDFEPVTDEDVVRAMREFMSYTDN